MSERRGRLTGEQQREQMAQQAVQNAMQRSAMQQAGMPAEVLRGGMPGGGMQRPVPQLQVPGEEDRELNQVMAESDAMVRATDPGPYQQTGMPSDAGGGPGEAEIRAVRTAEDEAAFNLGAKMGAQALAARATGDAPQPKPRGVTKDRLIEAERLLMEYRGGKTSVDARIIRAQQWWKLRNWEMIEDERGTNGATAKKSATAWLWNCIVGKHADVMDSYPEPVILPRMQEDRAEAEILSEIVPVIMQNNDFEETYSDCQWQKLQEGTACYHVGWDKDKLGGLGDISIRQVNMLNLYWEPGIEDIQESENLFYVQNVDTKKLEQKYPHLKGRLRGGLLQPNEYRTDDNARTSDKSVVVDWYYHIWDGQKKVLHYCQFVNEEILYSTENDGVEEGLYEDGEYPFILDPLYPVHGSPAGYGYIDIGKDAQADIDTINQAMVLNAVVTSTPRFFVQSDGAINEDEFADWSKPFVHSGGGLGENSIRQIVVNGIQGNAMNMLQQKIDELKFITGNTDVNNGGTPAGVTAASAIAALQEQSGRTSKDQNRGNYRCYNRIVGMVIERIRQFMSIPRQFRILGENGQEKFVQYSNAKLRMQQMIGGMGLEEGMRKPVFDIEVRCQRENAFTRMSQNELAIQFMQLGVYNPQMTDQSLMMLDMMEFKGKDELIRKVKDMGTMQEALIKIGQIAMALAAKYDPGIAQQLAVTMQGIGGEIGAGLTAGAAGSLPKLKTEDAASRPSDENALVRKARERTNSASRME